MSCKILVKIGPVVSAEKKITDGNSAVTSEDRRRVSVPLFYCIKTAKRRIMQITLHDSPGTLALFCFFLLNA